MINNTYINKKKKQNYYRSPYRKCFYVKKKKPSIQEGGAIFKIEYLREKKILTPLPIKILINH